MDIPMDHQLTTCAKADISLLEMHTESAIMVIGRETSRSVTVGRIKISLRPTLCKVVL